MTFIDAELLPRRKSGQIRLHGPEAFEGMRKAGRIAAEALDLLVIAAQPGVTTNALDKLAYEFGMDRAPIPRRWIIAAIANPSALRSIMSSATAFPTTSRCARATSSISTSPIFSTAGTAIPAAWPASAKFRAGRKGWSRSPMRR